MRPAPRLDRKDSRVTRIGAEWSPTTPGAVLAQAYLAAVDGGHLACVPVAGTPRVRPRTAACTLRRPFRPADHHHHPDARVDQRAGLPPVPPAAGTATWRLHYRRVTPTDGRHRRSPSIPLPVSSARDNCGTAGEGPPAASQAVARASPHRRRTDAAPICPRPSATPRRNRSWHRLRTCAGGRSGPATSGAPHHGHVRRPSGAVVVAIAEVARGDLAWIASRLAATPAAVQLRDHDRELMSGVSTAFGGHLVLSGLLRHPHAPAVPGRLSRRDRPSHPGFRMGPWMCLGWAYWAVEPWIGTDAAFGRKTAAESRLSQREDQRRDTDGQVGEVRTWRENDPYRSPRSRRAPSAGPHHRPRGLGNLNRSG